MSYLRQTQEWMATLLRHRRHLPDEPATAKSARVHVVGTDRLTPVERLEIYREQFWLRHTAALLEDFPGLSGILGQAAWERLVDEYLEEIAPTSWSLRDLGSRMPEHVERSLWLPRRELCADMARLEWTYVELFDAPDASPVEPAKLAAVPPDAWDRTRLVLSPALALFRAAFPVVELRERLRAGEAGSVSLPGRSPAYFVLYRDAQRELRHATVGEGAFALLEALRDGVPLVPACERAAVRVPVAVVELEEKAGEWFHDWARRGWIADVEG